MSINCIVGGTYGHNRGAVNVPRGNSGTIKFHLYDENGMEFDTAAVVSAIFRVAEGDYYSSSMYAGGDSVFTVSMPGGITKDPDLYTLTVNITPTNSAAVDCVFSYYELTVTLTGGMVHTVSSGVFTSNITLI